jgi:alkylated DNA nucleotide flippase Atl1
MSGQQARIQALFIRPRRETPLGEPAEQLHLLRGQGIEGDLHRQPASPRQVLVVRNEDIAEFDIAPGALGENMLISGLSEAVFIPGAKLQIGQAAVRLTMHCEPCRRIRPLVSSLALLENRRGLLGVVVQTGLIKVGDALSIDSTRFEPLPEKPYLRFLQILDQIPPGQVVSYKQIMLGMGVASSYARALPGYLRKAGGYPIHRIVDSQGALIEAHVPHQAQMLAAEGVKHQEGQIDLKRYGWPEPSLFLD